MVRMIQSRLAISLSFSRISAIGSVSRDDARYSRSPARSSRVGSSTISGILACADPVPMSAHPSTRGAVEPDMDLTRASGVLVVGEELPWCRAVTPPDGAEHHQVMAEGAFRGMSEVLAHGVDDPGVMTGPHPLQPLLVGGPRLRGDDVNRIRRLVLGDLLQGPEGV